MSRSIFGCLVALEQLFSALMSGFLLLAYAFLLLGVPQPMAQEAVERNMLEPLGNSTAAPTVAFPMSQSDVRSSASQPLPAPLTDLNDASTGAISQAMDGQEDVVLASDKPPLRIGLISERGATYLQAQIEPFRSYLQQTLSRPIEVVAFTSMKSLMAAHIGRQVDYSIYPASIFSMAYASCGCLTPMVAPISQQAPDGIYMILVVRGASGIKSLSDLSGRSMALSSKDGAIPFYMAMNELRKAGLNPERDLASLVGRDNPQEALELLDKGEVDAALVWSSTPYNQNLFSSEGAISAFAAEEKAYQRSGTNPDFLSIWHSPAIPAGPHVIHNEVSKQDKADLINALKEMNQRDPAAYDAIERRYGGACVVSACKIMSH